MEFIQTIIDTLTKYYEGFINYLKNIFLSLKLFFIDLPILIFEKAWAAVTWLFTWASESCAYCFSGTSSLPTQIQGGFNSLAGSSIGSGVLYCLQQAQIEECLRILTCGVIIWSVFKLMGFIKAAVF